eukprot:gene673-10379_t
MATLEEAIENVQRLENLALPDEQPNVEPPPTVITYRANFDTDFEDKEAFITGISRYMEEATIHQALNKLLEEGEFYSNMLYTWRCLSRAIPTARNDEQPNRKELYEKTIDVMGGEIQKLRDFMHFHDRSIDTFYSEVKKLCHVEKKRDFISQTHLLTLGKFINMFAVLDALKNMKACLSNDYAFYKRAETFLKQNTDAAALQESQNLTMFLATQGQITSKLKSKLEVVPGYEDLLCEIIDLCCSLYDQKAYVLPSEKHMLLKVIGFAIFLVDGKETNINKLDQKKKISISKIDKFFKQLPVVPLFGDMQISLIAYVKKCPHFEPSKWSCAAGNAEDRAGLSQYNLLNRMGQIHEEHLKIISELARCSNDFITSSSNSPITYNQCKDLFELALRGLRLVASWNSHVMELYHWKLLHPTDKYANPQCPDTAIAYERSTRYNYNTDEKFAMVQVIGMIKGLYGVMLKLEGVFSEAGRRLIHSEIQEFLQVTLQEPLKKTAKKAGKALTKSVLVAVRETAMDVSKNLQRDANSGNVRKDRDQRTNFLVDLPKRSVGPSTTQLYMLRTMLESLISEKAGKGKTMKKDLDGATLLAIDSFLKNSRLFPYILNFTEVLRECCDLSQLWFREFFLELTMGKSIQFPIEMSMPWILTDHILDANDAALMEYVLYPLDLYNDSAQYALSKFRKQFLYDEIEAEVNLCFDQFVYKLSEMIFAHYKAVAGSILLDKNFRDELERRYAEDKRSMPDGGISYPSSNRYVSLMKQKHVQLLGRSIDLNKMLTQRITTALEKSLDICISKFESGSLIGVVELESAIEVNRLAHSLLSKHLNLPEFATMIRGANHSVSVPYGRITLHVFWELYYDFLPNYCYNSSTNRFVRTTFSFAPEVTRESAPRAAPQYFFGSKALNQAFSSVHSLYTNFFGKPHFGCLVRLLGYHGIAVTIEELLKIVKNLLQGTIQQYVKVLIGGMPAKCGLPRYEYGSAGVLEYYNANLENIMHYGELKTEVFQAFREAGNVIVFCLLIEQEMTLDEINDLLHAAPFQGLIPRPFVKERDSVEAKMKRLEAQYASFQIVSIVSRYGDDRQRQNAEEAEILTKERLCCGLSLFEVVLKKISSFLTDEIWKEPPASNGVMSIEECKEFHRLWSAIHFMCCKPLGQHELTVEETFGEGLHWAGLTIIALLKQHKRFNALDFASHILKVQEVDAREEVVAGVDLKRLVVRIRRYKNLNRQIFAILNRYLFTSDSEERIRCFQPPIHQALRHQYNSI